MGGPLKLDHAVFVKPVEIEAAALRVSCQESVVVELPSDDTKDDEFGRTTKGSEPPVPEDLRLTPAGLRPGP